MLYGSPNKIINEIGIKLMSNQRFAKLLYYCSDIYDNDEYNMTDIDDLEDIENPVKVLKNNKVFYNRRIDKLFQRADASVFIRMGEFTLEKNTFLDRSYVEIGCVCHNRYLNTVNGDRNLCLIDTIQKVIDRELQYIGKLKFVRALPIRDLPTEYEGYYIIVEVTNYNENNLNR